MHATTTTDTAHASPDRVLRAKNRVASDFNALVSDAEELLRSTATYSGENVNAARARFQDTLAHFKDRIYDAQSAAAGRWREADVYVHDHPWKIVGVAAAVGLLVGVLLHRK